ncbi:doubled CXXCH motif [bacterium BMS3Abin04]|nr:doubled CXXCH motif [bacterium BMS3Abin04]
MLVKGFLKTGYGKLTGIIFSIILFLIVFVLFIYNPLFEWYTGGVNDKLTYDSSIKLTDQQFENTAKVVIYSEKLTLAKKLTINEKNEVTRQNRIDELMHTPTFLRQSTFKHIAFFRNAGIRKYEGPKTCLKCHKKIYVTQSNGTQKKVSLMNDVINSVHFTFQRRAAGFSIYGFNGKKVNEKGNAIPLGAIDRVCGIQGNLSWTGWATLIKTYPNGKDGKAVYRSEGCGQCHIGGNYQPATEKMIPFGYVSESAKNGIDCLICHSQNYDMNYKYVIKDKNGYRWNEDRTMKAAMSVTRTTSDNCLNCHQNDMGGDVYKNNKASLALGYKNQRIQHAGTKRGTPFSPEDDVHSAAGLNCTDCHVPEGHKIPRGTKGTDIIVNDIPGKRVECENCHSNAPHTRDGMESVMLNKHTNRIACETCHILQLEPGNVVLRDWVNPTWNKEEGIYTPTDILRSGKVSIGFDFYWFNGNGTFLAGALGANPGAKDKTKDNYNTYMDQYVSTTNPAAINLIEENANKYFKNRNNNLAAYIDTVLHPLKQLSKDLLVKREQLTNENLIPLQNEGISKIYPFKLFNARMYEDMGNSGPYGAMILPFDYQTYYETGNSLASVKKAIQNPIIKRMYQLPFKEYMMNDYMHYFGVDSWSDEYPLDEKGNLRKVKPKWMRQYSTFMLNHGIKKEGRTCVDCHSQNGIMNFEKLGYSKKRAEKLRTLKEINFSKKSIKQKTMF